MEVIRQYKNGKEQEHRRVNYGKIRNGTPEWFLTVNIITGININNRY